MDSTENQPAPSPLEAFLSAQGDPEALPPSVMTLYQAGKIDAARKALLAHAKTERSPQRKMIQEAVLRELRYWVKPAKAPTMYTLNGVGTNFYGSYQKGEDGVFVGTLWFVILFIPIYPIAAYLALKAEGGGYYFMGKTPLPPVGRVMRSAMVTALGAFMLAMVAAAWFGTRHTDVHAYNGFSVPLTVSVADQSEELAPRSATTFNNVAAEDGIPMTASLGGQLIEAISADLSGTGTDVVVYNVLGRAIIENHYVRYGPGDPPDGSLLDVGSVVVVDDIDYIFVEPPEEKQVKEGGHIDNTVLSAVEETEDFPLVSLVLVLLEDGQMDHALAIASAEARVSDQVDGLIPFLAGAAGRRDAATAKAWLGPLLSTRDDDVEIHRAWQSLHDGGDPELLASYQARLESDPSAENHYLVARLMDGRDDATIALLEKAAQLDPDSGLVWGSLGWNRGLRGEYAQAYDAFVKQAQVDPAAGESVDERLRMARLAGKSSDEQLALCRGEEGEESWASTHLLAELEPARLDGLVRSLDETGEYPEVFLASVLLAGGRLESARARIAELEPNSFDPSSLTVPLRLAMSDGATEEDQARAIALLQGSEPSMMPDYLILYGAAVAAKNGDSELAKSLLEALGTSDLKLAAPLMLDPTAAAPDLGAEGIRTRGIIASALGYRLDGAARAPWRAMAKQMALPDELPAWKS